MSRFDIDETPLAGLKRLTRRPLADGRGFFERLFCAADLAPAGWDGPIAQMNHAYTIQAGTVRGLHFQYPPHAEIKLVSCLRGTVWDVAVDLRRESPTFLQWHAETLSSDNGRSLLVPRGFAHGYQTLTDDADLIYCHSAAYTPDAEAGLNPRDPRLAIAWPLPITNLSERDTRHAPVDEGFAGVRL
jgi:dTDP-4-dehydrorhamnose 3,5-epimerase